MRNGDIVVIVFVFGSLLEEIDSKGWLPMTDIFYYIMQSIV